MKMVSYNDNETGFSDSDIHFACETFYRDCPDGYCTKRKFLTFIRKSSAHTSSQKPTRSNIFVQAFISRQNYRQSRKFFSMMFDIYDQNHDGQLDFNEYIYALSSLTGANRYRTIETLYKFFDINNQGYITRQEFNSRKKIAAQFLGEYKTGINDNLSYEEAFNTMDTNKDGRISKEEFIQWHLQDRLTADDIKPVKKRTRLSKKLSTLVDIRGQIKTSTLQQHDNTNNNKSPIDAWLETTMNVNNNFK
jgi:Ca2+-binding EF-hand superfamily protein